MLHKPRGFFGLLFHFPLFLYGSVNLSGSLVFRGHGDLFFLLLILK